MISKFIFVTGAFMALATLMSSAQTNTIPPSGNVGLNTNNPRALLDVNGQAIISGPGNTLTLEKTSNNIPALAFKGITGYSLIEAGDDYMTLYTGGNRRLTLLSNGYAGLGTTVPKSIFHIGRGAPAHPGLKTYNGLADTDEGFLFDYYYDTNNANLRSFDIVALGAANASFGGSQIRFLTSPRTGGSVTPAERMVIDHTGNVGVGTMYPTEKLSVKGKIRAQEVRVEATNWPDYVFGSEYELPDLEKTAQFIRQYKHLPEIPSEQKVAENGLNLGEMNSLLLKKIEELTLYAIGQHSRQKQLEQGLDKLREQNLKQQDEIDQLKRNSLSK